MSSNMSRHNSSRMSPVRSGTNTGTKSPKKVWVAAVSELSISESVSNSLLKYIYFLERWPLAAMASKYVEHVKQFMPQMHMADSIFTSNF